MSASLAGGLALVRTAAAASTLALLRAMVRTGGGAGTVTMTVGGLGTMAFWTPGPEGRGVYGSCNYTLYQCFTHLFLGDRERDLFLRLGDLDFAL